MTALFNSWVCDRCDPPKSFAPEQAQESSVKNQTKQYFTYSTNDALSEVGSGYKMYIDLDYVTNKTSKKARNNSTPYYIYQVAGSEDDYLDYSGTRPVSNRTVKVLRVSVSRP
jgi:hypothetical protein